MKTMVAGSRVVVLDLLRLARAVRLVAGRALV